ncbi:hypothetical protein QJQ45_007772 [Haematococcus lacustris]|nr:hypothetical protein QJQ45_007772 [Haematococcus lacustris]
MIACHSCGGGLNRCVRFRVPPDRSVVLLVITTGRAAGSMIVSPKAMHLAVQPGKLHVFAPPKMRSAGLLVAAQRWMHVRGIQARAAPMTETSVFLEEIAVSQTPKHLAALIRNMPMPVVAMRRGDRAVRLVSRSVNEHLHRALVEEDLAAGSSSSSSSSSRPLAAAAGPEGEEVYRPGSAAAAGFSGPKAALYVVRQAGCFPDRCEALAWGHLARGDQTSALVASEWYMRNNFFPGWARPYEFAAELFTRLKREEEARDMARVALRLPWWTLQQPFDQVAAVARFAAAMLLPVVPSGRTPEEVRYALSEEAAAAAQAQGLGRTTATGPPKTEQQLALERAASLLDMVAAGARPDYTSIRGELAEAYRSAGLLDMSNFIEATS